MDEDIRGFRSQVSRTPAEQEDYKGNGITVILKEDQYPHEFENLKKDGCAVPGAVPADRHSRDSACASSPRIEISISSRSTTSPAAPAHLLLQSVGMPAPFSYPEGQKDEADPDKIFHIIIHSDASKMFDLFIGPMNRMPLYPYGEGTPAWRARRIKAFNERLLSLFPYLRHLIRARIPEPHSGLTSDCGPRRPARATGRRGQGPDRPGRRGDGLHIRVVAATGTVVVAADEKELVVGQAEKVNELKELLKLLRPDHELTGEEKNRVVAAVVPIVDRFLMDRILEEARRDHGPAGRAAEEPDRRGRVVAEFLPRAGGRPVHRPGLQRSGRLVVDAPEAELRKKALGTRIDESKKRLGPLWGRPSLTAREEEEVINQIASILDQPSLWESTTKTNPIDGTCLGANLEGESLGVGRLDRRLFVPCRSETDGGMSCFVEKTGPLSSSLTNRCTVSNSNTIGPRWTGTSRRATSRILHGFARRHGRRPPSPARVWRIRIHPLDRAVRAVEISIFRRHER